MLFDEFSFTQNISLSNSGEPTGVPPKVGLFPIKVSTRNKQTGVEMAAGPLSKVGERRWLGFWRLMGDSDSELGVAFDFRKPP